jgi:protein-S-isoprenylcysteine O-methyltransferase Ste14
LATLAARAWLSLAALAAVMGALIFVAAGSLRYWHAWAYLLLFFGLSAAITLDLLRRDPALLERRMKGGPMAERRPLQRFVMLVASLGFVALLVVPALDFRFHWSDVPLGGVILGDVLFALGFGFIGRVYRENTYTSATIEVAQGQQVISTGPYAIVRHPMYASGLLYVLAKDMLACAGSDTKPVVLEAIGFSSSSDWRDAPRWSRSDNLALANLRAVVVANRLKDTDLCPAISGDVSNKTGAGTTPTKCC